MKIKVVALIVSFFAIGAGICACDCGKNEQVRHEHNYIETVTEPTCLYGGYSTFTCDCGKSYKDKETEKLGHDFDADNRCTRCGYLKHDHDYEKTVVEPTCTEGGYTRGKCKICGATYTSDQTEPLGHIYVDGICTGCNRLSYSVGMEYTLLDNDTYCLKGIGTATDTEIVIPSVYNGKAVTAVDYYFLNRIRYEGSFSSLTIPNSVTVITKPEYNPDSGIVVVLPGNLSMTNEYNNLVIYVEAESKPEEWPDNWNVTHCPVVWDCNNNDIAEDGCIYTLKDGIRYAIKDGNASVAKSPKNQIKELVIPQTITYKGNIYKVTSINNNVRMPDSLTSLTIPDSVTTIEKSAFSSCKKLTSIFIGKNVATIGENAFSYCDSLSNITVANGNVKYYSKNNCLIEKESNTLVLGCKNSIIPYGVSIIGKNAFSSCHDLSSISIPDSVTTIGEYAFNYCRGLATVTIPDSVTTIGAGAFYGCSELANITIGKGVTAISVNGFRYCDKLSNITVANGNAKYYSKNNCLIEKGSDTLVFGCKDSVIPYGVKAIGKNAFEMCINLAEITIPDSVTTIGERAFFGCSGLAEITVPNSVDSIGELAFGYYPYTLIIFCESADKKDGWDKDWNGMLTVVWNCKNNSVGTDGYLYAEIDGLRYALKDGKAKLARQYKNLSGYIVIPQTVTYKGNIYAVTDIGEYAFYDCDKLTSVTISSGVTAIGNTAFYGCTELINLTIPSSVTCIGSSVFSYCESLKSITFKGTINQWNTIEKIGGWYYDTGNYTVYCTDGNISKG